MTSCAGISRLERWERAKLLGLNPPEAVKHLIEQHSSDAGYTEGYVCVLPTICMPYCIIHTWCLVCCVMVQIVESAQHHVKLMVVNNGHY